MITVAFLHPNNLLDFALQQHGGFNMVRKDIQNSQGVHFLKILFYFEPSSRDKIPLCCLNLSTKSPAIPVSGSFYFFISFSNLPIK